MNEVRRYDIGSLGAVERMENGWLRAPGRLTRTGVFLYRNPDGSARRELRRPEEVFHPDALRSFSMVPVTVEHPPALLDASNTKEYSVGHVGENLVRDGDYVAASILLTDEEGIQAAEKDNKKELSCGYTCIIKDGAGTWQGQPYDCEQTQIRGNHVSLVERGRAGPAARLQLDRLDAVQEAPEGRNEMKKFLINGVWVELPEQAATAYEAQLKAHNDTVKDLTIERDTLKVEIEKAKAKTDSLQADLDKEKKARADAEHPDKIRTAVKNRIALEIVGLRVLGDKTKLDALSDREIQVKVVQSDDPSAKLDGVSDVYLQGRFDAVAAKASKDKTETSAPHLDTNSTTEKLDRGAIDTEELRKKTIKEENERSRKQLRG